MAAAAESNGRVARDGHLLFINADDRGRDAAEKPIEERLTRFALSAKDAEGQLDDGGSRHQARLISVDGGHETIRHGLPRQNGDDGRRVEDHRQRGSPCLS